MSRTSNWCWTLQYEGVSLIFKDQSRIKYCIFQLEEAESGYLHLQGYLELDYKTTLNPVKKMFASNTVHLEVRRGTQAQAIEYCSKAETRKLGPWEYGEKSNQGSRSDIRDALAVYKEGGRAAVANEFPELYVRMHRGLEAHRTATLTGIREKPEVRIYIGPPGCGKTLSAYLESPNVYNVAPPRVRGTVPWFDGYNGEDLLFDDFDGECPFKWILQVCDRYKLRAEVKCSFTFLTPKRIYFTSNRPWKSWWPDLTFLEAEAFERRVSKVLDFGTKVPGGNTVPRLRDLCIRVVKKM